MQSVCDNTQVYLERSSMLKGKSACMRHIYETCICTLRVMREMAVIAGMDAGSRAHGQGGPFARVGYLPH
jgi:hypothetical protein